MVIDPMRSGARVPAGIEAIEFDGIGDGGGNVTDRGTACAMASTPCTFGRLVVTEPGSEASENDQPPPTARMGRCSVSACWIAHAMSSALRGKNIRSAMYAWVFDQFCHQWFGLEMDATLRPPSRAISADHSSSSVLLPSTVSAIAYRWWPQPVSRGPCAEL